MKRLRLIIEQKFCRHASKIHVMKEPVRLAQNMIDPFELEPCAEDDDLLYEIKTTYLCNDCGKLIYKFSNNER